MEFDSGPWIFDSGMMDFDSGAMDCDGESAEVLNMSALVEPYICEYCLGDKAESQLGRH